MPQICPMMNENEHQILDKIYICSEQLGSESTTFKTDQDGNPPKWQLDSSADLAPPSLLAQIFIDS